MKKSHLKQIIEALAEELIQIKAAHKLTEQVSKDRNSRLASQLEKERKKCTTQGVDKKVFLLEAKLDEAINAKAHYYGRVRTLKSSLEKQAEEKVKLQREIAELKNKLKNH